MNESESQAEQLRKNFSVSLGRYNILWSRWKDEYLRQLHLHYKDDNRQAKVGDIVLLGKEGSKYSWPLARITDVFPGRDGRVRNVKLILGSGKSLNRPVQCLYPLEFS